MPFTFTPLSLPVIISMVITTILAVMAYVRRKDNPIAEIFAGLMFAVTLWSFCYFMGLSSSTIEGKYFWMRLKYIGAASAPVIWLDFSVHFTKHEFLSKSKFFKHFKWIFPTAVFLLALTNPYHHLIWKNVWIEPGFPEEFVTHAPFFYVYFVITYLMVVVSLVLYLIYYLKSSQLYKSQALMMLLGSLFPLIASASFSFFGLDLVPKLDETILAFLLSGIVFSFALFRFKVLEIIPIANQLILKRLNEGIIVLNQENNILKVNPSAEMIFGLKAENIFGKNAREIFADWPQLFLNGDGQIEVESEIHVFRENNYFYYLVKKSPIVDDQNRFLGNILLVSDITKRKAAEIELEHLATHDPLTQIYNRRHFYTLAERELSRARRYEHSLGFMICDIDFFKVINDSFGHMVGDEALKKVTELCSKNLRKSDIFARYGGEEFAVLLPEIPVEDLRKTGEKIRKIIEETRIQIEGYHIELTISIGMVHYSDFERSNLIDCLKKADQALYVSKDRGRNQTTMWHEKLEALHKNTV